MISVLVFLPVPIILLIVIFYLFTNESVMVKWLTWSNKLKGIKTEITPETITFQKVGLVWAAIVCVAAIVIIILLRDQPVPL